MQVSTLLSLPLSLSLISAASLPVAQEPVDWEAVTRIRDEGMSNSRVMDTIWHLTDLYGPRLTNSPQERRASQWAKERFIEFGLQNVELEPWGEFGLGWSFERCVVEMTSPTYMPMIAIPRAWTLGIDGPVSGVPILIDVKSAADLAQYEGQLAGKIVLNGKVTDVEPHFDPMAKRHDDETLAELQTVPEPDADSPRSNRRSEWRKRRELRDKLREMLRAENAAVLIEPDGGRRNDYGVIMLGSGGSTDPEKERGLPQVTVSTEQFNRIARLIEKGTEVRMNVEVSTTFYDDDTLGYNVVAELPGSDPELADEVVMLGAHFDSWHAATGATDNGGASGVVIEAMRILKAVGFEPRRTIRAALWTGEEQGLLGSRGYVKTHFADPEVMEPSPEHGKLAGYFNLDNGTGRIRGVYMQENLAVKPIFEAWLEPFHDMGAQTLTYRNTGGTDHLSFDAVGLPGFQFIQDPMDYGSRSHHTNMDTYERVIETDVIRSSIILASFVYHAAQRDEKLPRKPLPEAPEPIAE